MKLLDSLKSFFGTPMRCPVCLHPMKAWKSKEELHVDPSGHGLYVCMNRQCPGAGTEAMIYRRVLDGVVQTMEAGKAAAARVQAEQLQDYYRLNGRSNELTEWLRDRYPQMFQGQFRDQFDVALNLLEQDWKRQHKTGE